MANLSKETCNIPTIILSLINAYVDIMSGYDQSDVICELYFFVLLIKYDANYYGDMEKIWGMN